MGPALTTQGVPWRAILHITHLAQEVTEWAQSVPGTQPLLSPDPGLCVCQAVRLLELQLVQ